MPLFKTTPTKLYWPPIPKDFVVIVDTREQLPYKFNNPALADMGILTPTVIDTLHTGDYSIAGHENEFTVERKNRNDFYGSFFSKERDREKKKIERMGCLDFKAYVIECTENTLLNPLTANFSVNINPNSIKGTLASLVVKYGVHVYFGSRDECENQTLNWMVMWFNWQMKLKKEKEI